MLSVIEGRALEYIREMQGYTLTDNARLLRAEGECKKQYISERADMMKAKDEAEY